MRIPQLLLTITLFLFILPASGQSIEVTEVNEKMSQGKKNGLSVVIPEASVDMVEDGWDKWLRKEINASTSNKKGEIWGEEAELDDMGDLPFMVYSKIEEADNGTRLTIFVDLGGAYLNSSDHDDRYEVMVEQLRQYSIEAANEALEEKLSNAEDKLDDAKSNLEDIVDNKEDLEDDIEDYEEEIEECKQTIKKAEKNIEQAKEKIAKYEKQKEEQQQKVEERKEKVREIEKKKSKID